MDLEDFAVQAMSVMDLLDAIDPLCLAAGHLAPYSVAGEDEGTRLYHLCNATLVEARERAEELWRSLYEAGETDS